ncbi:MAG: hypothetical protein LBT01_06130 [Spirochaetaceae bacterium]|jgi:hypothetical protein|nr:hypothetical protein [Spirochaetaceae bacterium]
MGKMIEQTRQPQRGLTFDDVWAAMMETDRKFQETDRKFQETDRKFQESKVEYDKRQKKLDAQIDKLGKQLGGLHRSVGELIETLIASRLWKKFPKYKFNRVFQRIKILDNNNEPVTEIDILLSDDEWAMTVEVKREPDKNDVKHHLKRMKIMREYSLNEIKGKKLLGAIAGGVVSPEVRECAQQSGFYVLELNGEQVSLIKSPEGFVPLQC